MVVLIILNAIRWWGCLAGIICISDIFRCIVHPSMCVVNTKVGISINLTVALFLIIMGIATPLFPIIPNLVQPILLIGWVLISLAGWLIVFKHSDKLGLMMAVAGLGLFTTLLASYLVIL